MLLNLNNLTSGKMLARNLRRMTILNKLTEEVANTRKGVVSGKPGFS